MLKTALIVDDSRLARLTLKRLLLKYDIDVREAEGVIDAERWIFHHLLPDVIFMDVMMPELDGFEGLARLRANEETSKIPVIMYSGDISETTRKKARDQGATGYLPKPVDASGLDHLLSVLTKRLQARKKQKVEAAALRPTPARAQKTGDGVSRVRERNSPLFATERAFDSDAASLTAPEQGTQWPQTNELLRRMNEIEHRLTIPKLNSGSIDLNVDLGRQRRDVIRLQRQLLKNERRTRRVFFLAGLAIVLALVNVFQSFL